MDFMKLGYQSTIRFLTNEGKGLKVIFKWMMAVYDYATPSEYQVKQTVQVGYRIHRR